MRITKKIILLALPFLSLMTGCEKQQTFLSIEDYTQSTIAEIHEGNEELAGEKLMAEGYILGLEIQHDITDNIVWVMVLGDAPYFDETGNSQLIFPTIKNKIRVGEDGYNNEIMKRCYSVCEEAKQNGRSIKVFGTFLPSEPFNHYNDGVDLQLDAVKIGSMLINTDYEDHGKLKERTPGLVRKLYKGGKQISKLLKKAVL